MRRIIALSLMMLVGSTLIAPLFASEAGAYRPPCCRRSGKHHCMIERHSGQRMGFASISEKCPYCPAGTLTVHSQDFKPESAKQFFSDVVRHPAIASQPEALHRISSFRSHPKRGPPLA